MTIVNDLDQVAVRLPATRAVECNTITQAARRLTRLADQLRGVAATAARVDHAVALRDIADQISPS